MGNDMGADEQAIRELVDTWMRATRAGDTQTVLSLMADDVVFMVAGREPFGREAFAAQSNALQGVTIDGHATIVELQVLGDWAYVRSHIEVAMTQTGQASHRRAGYTLTILRKQGGRWLLARDANMVS
jgi:uncharacterized protein (TIGR02246 family)